MKKSPATPVFRRIPRRSQHLNRPRDSILSLKDAVRDPLATKIRYVLKKIYISSSEIATLFSSEKSACKLLPLDAEKAQIPEKFGIVENSASA
ncbi:hypothetical protein PR003_g1028 [Phytophthora rubi]|uniref:Uncharacterized protein n=1 Tax=Phytophthora rubi TaxID=129364 RepID=A0A6A3PBY8_9STRA|nr:hypothetical protein PR001_g1122 [Phytophthora rubi]KAE9358907.1 hypothetical protein PR003_g1028 [Phytophthora rubi]